MRINKVAFAVTALLAASQVNAAGFQVSEHSASGLGRAFAGEAAIGDNAAALARNPAIMATFDKAALSIAGSYVAPNVDITGPEAKDSAKDVAPAQFVPAAYYIHPINDKVAVGLVLNTNYGTGTEYADDYLNGTAAGTTHIVTMNFNPNVSYRINDQFSVGAGVSFVYGTAELERNAGIALGPIKPSTLVAKMEGDGYGFGWNVGALYEINKNNRLGISYKAKVGVDLEGEYTGTSSLENPQNPFSPQKTVDGTLDINLPSILEISGYHKLTDQFAVSYSWLYSTWSDFGDILGESVNPGDCNDGGVEGQCLLKKEDYDDQSRYAIGGEYYASEDLTIRVGYAFDEQAGKSTLSIPDTDRSWYTAGLTYRTSPALSFDFAVAYIDAKEVTFEEEIPLLGKSKEFTSTGDAWIYSAQMNYSF